MNNYLIEFNGDYGIYQTEEEMREVKMRFNENASISRWDKLEQIQNYATKQGFNYVGFDMFYK